MSLDDEDAVKQALGIRSFGHMSKRKMLAFAATMPQMTDVVRLKLLDQIPGLQRFTLDAIDQVQQIFDTTVEANDQSQARAHRALDEVRDILRGELNKDGLGEEQRLFLITQIIENGDKASAKDSENKQFVSEEAARTRSGTLRLAGMGLVAVLVLAGGKVLIERLETEADPDADEGADSEG